MKPLSVYVGFDPKETIAFHVLAHSILTRASGPVAIIPLVRGSLGAIHSRPRGQYDSTEFSITRFLVPYLSGYEGFSAFMDCDMLCLTDIYELPTMAGEEPDRAVWVCQHNYVPKSERKFLDQVQTKYPRKNWSSLMVFNNARCRALTPEYVNTAPGLDLHGFQWLSNHSPACNHEVGCDCGEVGEIGSLPLEFNWLVGEYPANGKAKILHYTIGGPWFEESAGCDHADLWFAERERAFSR